VRSSHRARAHHGNRIRVLRSGGGGPNNIAAWSRPRSKTSGSSRFPPAQRGIASADDRDGGFVFSGLQKNDGRGVNGTGDIPSDDCHRSRRSPTTNVPAQAQPGARPVPVRLHGQFKRLFLLRRHGPFTTGDTRSSDANAASCGRTRCSIRHGEQACSRTGEVLDRGFNRPGSIW